MANENEALLLKENELLTDIDDFDLDELESQLDEILNSDLDNLQISKEEQDKISDPNSLGTTVLNIVWDNFIGQVAIQSGNDFIKENNGLTLDLSKDAHFLNPDEFEKGNLPQHNIENKEKYEKRLRETKADFQTDPDMQVKMSSNMRYNEETKTYERFDKKTNKWVGKARYNQETKTWEDYNVRTEKWEKKLTKDARTNFDTRTQKEKGSKTVNKDHVISAAEQIRDTEAATYMDREERQAFAKSEVNIQDLDSNANQSKSDLTTEEWLNEVREDGKKQAEYFGLDEEELRENDKKAREAYEKEKEKAKNRAISEGKKSQRKELFKISGAVLRTIIIQLLMELGKRIVGHLISWLKTSNKKLKDLLIHIKQAIIEFGVNLKNHLVDLGKNIVSTIFSALGGVFGIIARTLNRVWGFLKQGFNSVKEVFQYLKDPSTKEKSAGIIGLQLGKIVVSGAAAAGGMVLSEAIEAVLAYYGGPVLNFEIPLLGSLASLLGVFLGGVISGIAGALALYHIDKMIANKLRGEASQQVLANANRVVSDNAVMLSIKERKMERAKKNAINNIKNRSKEAEEMFTEMINEDMSDVYDEENQKRIKENSIKLDSI